MLIETIKALKELVAEVGRIGPNGIIGLSLIVALTSMIIVIFQMLLH